LNKFQATQSECESGIRKQQGYEAWDTLKHKLEPEIEDTASSGSNTNPREPEKKKVKLRASRREFCDTAEHNLTIHMNGTQHWTQLLH